MNDVVKDHLLPPNKHRLVGPLEILRALITKELKVKYKRSILGFLWSLVTPVALTGVYLFVFIYVYRVPKPDFVLFLLSGLLPWNYFNMSILASTNSMVENGSVIRKVYFPRILIPTATVGANLITFLMALGLLVIVVVFTGRPLWLHIHWLVLAVTLQTFLCVGVSVTLSVWNVYFRDIAQMISIFMLVLFFATPIVYDVSLVPTQFLPLILANPLAGIMELYRAALFEARNPDFSTVLLSLAETAAIVGFGWLVYRKHAAQLAKEV